MCLLLGALDQDHQVVRVADEPVGRVAPRSQVLASAGVAAHLLPVRLILAVQRGEGDVGQQWRDDSALRSARHRPLKAAGLRHHAGLQKRPHEFQDALVFDTSSNLAHQLGVVDAVKARLDVRFDDPLVVRGGVREVDDLSDRVMGSTAGPIAIGRRVETDLEDRLQDELEGHLSDPVFDRRDSQATLVAIAFGDLTLADGRRPELALLELVAQPPKELLRAELLLDAVTSHGVHTGGA